MSRSVAGGAGAAGTADPPCPYCATPTPSWVLKAKGGWCMTCDMSDSSAKKGRGKTWLYILRNRVDDPKFGQQDYFYVGVTYKLGTRLEQHATGGGAKATRVWDYGTLVALYPVAPGQTHRLDLENRLTLELMKLKGEKRWWQVRGGSWCSLEKKDGPPPALASTPAPAICRCGFPAWGGKCPKRVLPWVRENLDLGQEIECECRPPAPWKPPDTGLSDADAMALAGL